ncbi:hypothetical protein RND81_04G016200 [Saponaria officinalis]|uniref:rRNA N-glycosylase n=1 Tax=Saponaria officinalis TaxID=3572 RepID=A0AAW1LFK4_SAPOF
MKSWVVLVVTWLIILQSLVSAVITYKLNLHGTTKEQYSSFLKEIRDDVMDPNLHYGGTDIPVIKANLDPRFLRIDLEGSTGTASLAVQRSNLYVLAYLAKNDEKKFRAYYFKNQISTAELDGLFSEAQGTENHQEIEYTEKYPDIEAAAEMTRQDAGLGVKKFAAYMAEVNGKPHVKKNEARFILFAAEMVAEATRFKYIEDLVLEHFEEEIEKVDDKVILLETFWGPISAATKTSYHGKFKKTLRMKKKGIKTKWNVHDVKELNMGILLHIAGNNGLLWIIGLIITFLVILVLIYYVRFIMTKSHRVKKDIKSH